MGVTTERYIRKPLYVEAVRVNANNFDDCVTWCQGEVQTDEVPGTGTIKKYIKVRVTSPKNQRQTKAFINDWILYTDRGYKVYTNKAFRAAFDLVTTDRETVSNQRIQGEKIEVVEATPQAIADAVNEQHPKYDGGTPESEGRDNSDNPVGAAKETSQTETVSGENIVPAEGTVDELTDVETPVAPQSEPVSEDAAAGKYVLSQKEQADLGPEGVREMLASGEAVLAQDLAESA